MLWLVCSSHEKSQPTFRKLLKSAIANAGVGLEDAADLRIHRVLLIKDQVSDDFVHEPWYGIASTRDWSSTIELVREIDRTIIQRRSNILIIIDKGIFMGQKVHQWISVGITRGWDSIAQERNVNTPRWL